MIVDQTDKATGVGVVDGVVLRFSKKALSNLFSYFLIAQHN